MKIKLLLGIVLLFLLASCTSITVVDEPLDVNVTSPIDTYSNSLMTIDFEHSRVHNGEGFQYSHRETAITAGGNVTYILNSSTATHLRDTRVSCDATPVLFEIYEGSTFSNIGTEQTYNNRNRIDQVIENTTLYMNPTLTGLGTRLYIDEIFGDKHTAGSFSHLPVEWVLQPNEHYLLMITNNNGGGVNCVINLFWYHTH